MKYFKVYPYEDYIFFEIIKARNAKEAIKIWKSKSYDRNFINEVTCESFTDD
jgi:hypothetical protein